MAPTLGGPADTGTGQGEQCSVQDRGEKGKVAAGVKASFRQRTFSEEQDLAVLVAGEGDGDTACSRSAVGGPDRHTAHYTASGHLGSQHGHLPSVHGEGGLGRPHCLPPSQPWLWTYPVTRGLVAGISCAIAPGVLLTAA